MGNNHKSNAYARNDLKYTVILPVVAIASFLLIWEMIGVCGLVSTTYLPRPSQLLETFAVKLSNPNPEGATLLENLASSLKTSLGGFVIAIFVGIPLGLFMGYYKSIDRFVKPVLEVIRPIPPIAWIPLTIVLLGIGFKAKVFIICFAAFVPCVLNSYTGVKMTNPTLINVAKTCGASRFSIFINVCVPSAVPMVIAGVRLALAASWSTLVAAEMLASSSGLGYMIQMGRLLARPDLIVLGMLIIGLIGFLLSSVLSSIERKLLGWRYIR